MSQFSRNEALLTRIRQMCQERGWFGADEWLDGGYSTRPALDQHFAPPAPPEAVQSAEETIGFPLPPLLRTLYLSLANGNVGPGYGILSVEDLLQTYQQIHADEYCEGAWKMPPQVFPLCYWGCSLYSLLDAQSETAMFVDLDGLAEGHKTFTLEAPSLAIWFNKWLEGTGIAAGIQGEDFEPQDDPETIMPPYLLEYRRLCAESA